MVSIFARSAAAPSDALGLSRTGVFTASSAPAPIASNTFEELSSTFAVTITMAHGELAMIRRVASTPPIFGIIKSIRIKSGVSAAQRATASSPSSATHANWWPLEPMTTRRTASTAIITSLTIAILMSQARQLNPQLPEVVSRHENCLSSDNNPRRLQVRASYLLHDLYTRQSLLGWL